MRRRWRIRHVEKSFEHCYNSATHKWCTMLCVDFSLSIAVFDSIRSTLKADTKHTTELHIRTAINCVSECVMLPCQHTHYTHYTNTHTRRHATNTHRVMSLFSVYFPSEIAFGERVDRIRTSRGHNRTNTVHRHIHICACYGRPAALSGTTVARHDGTKM